MTLQIANLASTAISSATYDDETGELTIVMADGSEIVKTDIEPDVWDRLKNAPSPGGYFNAEIRGR